MEYSYRDGARRILPFAVVGFAFAASFGVLAGAAGVGTAAAVVMSATTFGGSAPCRCSTPEAAQRPRSPPRFS